MPIRILLADLAHTTTVQDTSLTVPLSLGYIKAYAVERYGAEVDIRLFKHPERLLAAVHETAPDIIGLANYGWNSDLNLRVGTYLRERLPRTLIVAGGPNVDNETLLRERFLRRHRYLDLLIVDGGEEPFAEIIAWWQEGRHPDRLPANVVALGSDGTLIERPTRPLSKKISGIPSPYLSGHLDEFLAAGMVPLLETNRGCPFRCTFCAWGMASQDLVRRFDQDTALAEIAYVGARSRALNWIVCDANFGILKRDVDLARAIRAVRDETGYPRKCHIWLAKNATSRNLEIGEILGDMTVPVMAVQSMNEEVLKNIKRDNISIETYAEYQKKFHKIGSRTYSDMIVPLPAETLETHLAGLRHLTALGVDIIQSHNMRMLAGAEMNLSATREAFAFKTRYRLIHGDSGIYRAPDGVEIRSFEVEESLRSTLTMSEADLFYLRKLHFILDFSWNLGVYGDLLRLGLKHGLNPIDALMAVVAKGARPGSPTAPLWEEFDRASHAEWFDTEEDIRAFFADDGNFKRLLNQEFEKLNIQFAVIVLRDYKEALDTVVLDVLRQAERIPAASLESVARFTFLQFPPLTAAPAAGSLLPANLADVIRSEAHVVPSPEQTPYRFRDSEARQRVLALLADTSGKTLSKILNTQGISLRELRCEPEVVAA